MLDRLVSVFVAISLALLVWLYARSRDQEILDHVPIPVEVTLASAQGDQYSLEVVGPAQVVASFTGPPSRIRELRGLLQRDGLKVDLTYSVPPDRLKESKINETLVVEPGDLHAPAGLTPVLVPGRNQVRILLHRLVERRLPVRFEHSLERYLGQVVVEPSTVLVRGPQEVLDRATAIATQPSVLPQADKPRALPSVRVPLVRELEGRAIQCEPSFVRVHGGAPARRTYDLTEVPVHFLCPADFPLRPRFHNDRAGKVALKLVGPPQEEAPRVYAYVDLTTKGFPGTAPRPGLYEEPVQLQLPRDFQLADGAAVRNVSFELAPADAMRGMPEVPLDRENND